MTLSRWCRAAIVAWGTDEAGLLKRLAFLVNNPLGLDSTAPDGAASGLTELTNGVAHTIKGRAGERTAFIIFASVEGPEEEIEALKNSLPHFLDVNCQVMDLGERCPGDVVTEFMPPKPLSSDDIAGRAEEEMQKPMTLPWRIECITVSSAQMLYELTEFFADPKQSYKLSITSWSGAPYQPPRSRTTAALQTFIVDLPVSTRIENVAADLQRKLSSIAGVERVIMEPL